MTAKSEEFKLNLDIERMAGHFKQLIAIFDNQVSNSVVCSIRSHLLLVIAYLDKISQGGASIAEKQRSLARAHRLLGEIRQYCEKSQLN